MWLNSGRSSVTILLIQISSLPIGVSFNLFVLRIAETTPRSRSFCWIHCGDAQLWWNDGHLRDGTRSLSFMSIGWISCICPFFFFFHSTLVIDLRTGHFLDWQFHGRTSPCVEFRLQWYSYWEFLSDIALFSCCCYHILNLQSVFISGVIYALLNSSYYDLGD